MDSTARADTTRRKDFADEKGLFDLGFNVLSSQDTRVVSEEELNLNLNLKNQIIQAPLIFADFRGEEKATLCAHIRLFLDGISTKFPNFNGRVSLS